MKKIFKGIKFFKVQDGNILIETGKPIFKSSDSKEESLKKVMDVINK